MGLENTPQRTDLDHLDRLCRCLCTRGGSRLRRELQDGRILTCAQMREQDHLAVRKLERIMVRALVLRVDLSEARDLVSDRLPSPPEEGQLEAGRLALDLAIKADLRAGKQTHRHIGLTDRRKAARGGIPELLRDEAVADTGRPRRDPVQTII